MIYVSGGTKGGTGKSTLAVNLVVYLALKQRDVLLVDADDQETSTDFTTIRDETLEGKPGYTAVQLVGANLRTQILKQAEKYDDIVIDVGGRDTMSSRAALTVADVCIVPFKPKSFDVWTFEKVEGLIQEARLINENLAAYSFLNEAFTNVKVKDNEIAAEALISSEVIKYTGMMVYNRKAFSDSTASGLSVFELKDVKAVSEMEKLFEKFVVLD